MTVFALLIGAYLSKENNITVGILCPYDANTGARPLYTGIFKLRKNTIALAEQLWPIKEEIDSEKDDRIADLSGKVDYLSVDIDFFTYAD